MADILSEGSYFGLRSRNDEGKTGVHLKLTDSALGALDDYQNIKGLTSFQPSIQLNGRSGILKIPSKTDGGIRVFSFSLSNKQGDPKGSFDCVQQHSASSGSTLDMVGSLNHKITIHANDDVYTTTREKMTIAEEASKKVCTKEIKPSGSRVIGRKIKKIIKRPQPGIVLPATTHHIKKPTPTLGSAGSKPVHPSSASKFPPPAKPTQSVASVASSGYTPKTGNPAVMSQPYRDRVIHLLALKAYKKPELLLILQKDGIKAKDKDSLGSLLKQVAKFNQRDNTFTLLKGVYKEVRGNWPFYTDADKQLLKRRLSQISYDSPSHSPSSTQQSPPQKRLPDESLYEPAMKQRITHYKPKVTETEPDSQSDMTEHSNMTSKSVASSTSETPDYVIKYTPVTNDDQRRHYKDDFNVEYEEYRQLHVCIEKIVKRFVQLESTLRKCDEGSDDYEHTKKKIYQEYSSAKSDPKYQEQRKRHDYLHQKLAHIKKLVLEYDHSQNIHS